MNREFVFGAFIGSLLAYVYLRHTEYGPMTIIPRSEPLNLRGRPVLERYEETEDEDG